MRYSANNTHNEREQCKLVIFLAFHCRDCITFLPRVGSTKRGNRYGPVCLAVTLWYNFNKGDLRSHAFHQNINHLINLQCNVPLMRGPSAMAELLVYIYIT